MSLSVSITPAGPSLPGSCLPGIRIPAPASAAYRFLSRHRSPLQAAGLMATVFAHTLIAMCLLLISPHLARTIDTGGRSACDLTHVTARQALYGTVCGVRILRVTGHPYARGGRGQLVLTAAPR